MVRFAPTRGRVVVTSALMALLFGAGSAASPRSAAPTSVDISGIWQWTQTTLVQARPFTAAVIFGITPEGAMTHITCQSGGELTIVMLTESTFEGSATQSSTCRTRGGFEFNPFPPTLQLENGVITGQSFRFDFTSGGIPCPQTGGIQVLDGQAVLLRGSGDCTLPDEHPLLGSYKDVHFAATR